MTRNVAIVGISANPVTNGHLSLMDAVANTGHFQEVWLMPCYGHKFGKELASAEHRLAMCRLALEDRDSRYKISDFEIKNQSNGVAFNTIRGLRMTYTNVKFHWVIGMDNANIIERWAFSEKLRSIIPFCVLPRQGVAVDPDVTWYLQGHHRYIDVPTLGCASTDVRRFLAAQDFTSAMKLLPPKVYQYILYHSLYQENL